MGLLLKQNDGKTVYYESECNLDIPAHRSDNCLHLTSATYLPPELVLQIVRYMDDVKDLIALSGVNHPLRSVCTDPQVWKLFIQVTGSDWLRPIMYAAIGDPYKRIYGHWYPLFISRIKLQTESHRLWDSLKRIFVVKFGISGAPESHILQCESKIGFKIPEEFRSWLSAQQDPTETSKCYGLFEGLRLLTCNEIPQQTFLLHDHLQKMKPFYDTDASPLQTFRRCIAVTPVDTGTNRYFFISSDESVWMANGFNLVSRGSSWFDCVRTSLEIS
ncbi:hypothetical protein PROFUN_14088 [Planoprotostelium fungivorum]|uniref:F-box domain-containing protein n=1 Tax=Planoprotostelium fungivorum TaxID=1890364 RepID=A0A2P6N240_9EUKA|nr:hypothetical protein PROFUN_14088 [Planoprotostelium fungivorum]